MLLTKTTDKQNTKQQQRMSLAVLIHHSPCTTLVLPSLLKFHQIEVPRCVVKEREREREREREFWNLEGETQKTTQE